MTPAQANWNLMSTKKLSIHDCEVSSWTRVGSKMDSTLFISIPRHPSIEDYRGFLEIHQTGNHGRQNWSTPLKGEKRFKLFQNQVWIDCTPIYTPTSFSLVMDIYQHYYIRGTLEDLRFAFMKS